MRVRVEVTQDDIDKGARNCGSRCPIARSLKRCLGVRHVWVYRKSVRLDEKAMIGDMPKLAQKFIHEFDNRCTVHPFGFYIRFKKDTSKPIEIA